MDNKRYIYPHGKGGHRLTKEDVTKMHSNSEFQWEEELRKKLKELGYSFDELFREPPFTWTEIVVFLKASILIAEEFFPNPNNGPTKLQLVMSIWDYYDSQFHLVEQIDELIDFRTIFGIAVGSIVEMFDDKAIRALIEVAIIPALVALLFPNVKR